MKTAQLQQRRKRVVDLCQGLPEVEIEGDQHLTFRVRKKTLAYYLNNHQGDGIVGLVCKAHPGDQHFLMRMDPIQFFVPAYVGPRGWVGLRLDRDDVDWAHASRLVESAYRLSAPKRLVVQLAVSAAPPKTKARRKTA